MKLNFSVRYDASRTASKIFETSRRVSSKKKQYRAAPYLTLDLIQRENGCF